MLFGKRKGILDRVLSIEVKVTRIGGYWNRAFIQVSATNMLMAAQIMDAILKEVKEVFEEADSDD